MRHNIGFIISGAAILALFFVCSPTQPADTISGVVRDADAPVAGAVVRVQTTDISTNTDDQGRFTLSELPSGETLAITAWAPGYFISGLQQVKPGRQGITLELTPHAKTDNPAYAWVSAFSSAGEEGNCQNCHDEADNPNSDLPFSQWKGDAHALST